MNKGYPSSQQQGNKKLTLNFCEIILNKNLIQIQKAPFAPHLSDTYKDNVNFYIHKDGNSLYTWELNCSEHRLPKEFKRTPIKFDEQTPIFKKIIEMAIVEFFRSTDYQIYKKRYSQTWEVEIKREKDEPFGSLILRPILAFSVNNLYSKTSKKQIVALTIKRRYKPVFTGSEEEIQKQLADTRDLTRNHVGQIVASSHNISRYLEATGQAEAYRAFQDQTQNGKSEFDFLKSTVQRFNEVSKKLYLPDCLEVDDFLLVHLPNASFQASKIAKPRYYYYNERVKGGYYNKIVAELGPYSLDIFKGKKIGILVISPDEYEGSVGEYIVKLHRNLKNLFHLDQIEFTVKTITPPETYLDIINQIDATDYKLAIIIVSQQDKTLPIPKSPYHLTKAKLLNQRLPTQELTIEVIRQSNMFTDNNIALNIYSKLGGTAWTIEKTEKEIAELIVGIGSTVDEDGNWVIGFANVFDYNGTYLVGDCSQLSTKENYTENLEKYLVSMLKQTFDLKGLSSSDEVRLLFHLFKEAGENSEIRAISNALQHFKGHNIQHGFVHLSYNHNFRLFLNQGKETPERGTFIQLSSRQALLHLGGKSSVPVQVWLDKRSGYKDIYAVTKQVLYFAHLSYRTFMPPSKPVTIKYPSLMAKMVSELCQIPGWDIAMLNRLNDKLWFI